MPALEISFAQAAAGAICRKMQSFWVWERIVIIAVIAAIGVAAWIMICIKIKGQILKCRERKCK